jgi:arsenate reductase-like glutaredoxin family protein/uncharacterized OB-fold protein
MAFFQCSKCKRIWQYPIEKCPDCFLKLDRVKSEKVKIIGGGKTTIPSIFHQKVPYFVYVLEDENKNRWIQKSEKELRVGEEIEIEKAKNKDAVAIWRVKYDFFEAIEKLVEILTVKFEKNSKILILPTLVKDSHSYFRDNTSPEFLESAIQFLMENGVEPQNIKVCSQSFDEVEIERKAQKSGLFEVCQRQKIIPFDLAKGNFVKKGDLEISEEVLKADLILNLPILKIGKASSCENLFFLLKKENYLAQKYLHSDVEIFEKLKNQIPEVLTIAEGNRVQDKNGIVHYLNLALASFDPKNLDRVFCEIIKEKELPEIIKEVKIENIEILGRKISEVEFYF